MNQKKSVLLITSAVIATLYTIYLIYYFTSGLTDSSGTEALGGAIAGMMMTPHLIATAVAALLNWIAALMNKQGLALAAVILYVVAACAFFLYALFLLPSIILTFIGYLRMRKANK